MAYLEGDRSPGQARPAHPRLNRPRRPAPAAWLPAALAVAALAAWETGAGLGWISGLYFPAPSRIARAAAGLLVSGSLLPDLGATLLRTGLALLFGGLPGALAGLAMGWSAPLRRALDPLVAALHPLPKVAVLPLLFVLFGLGERTLVIVTAMGAFFPLLINTMTGVRQIHPIYYEVARSYGASPWLVFRRVVWPGCRPWLVTGLRLALNAALLLGIAAEMVYAKRGLGAMILMAWQTMRTEEIYVSLALIILLGLSYNAVVHALAAAWIPWGKESAP